MACLQRCISTGSARAAAVGDPALPGAAIAVPAFSPAFWSPAIGDEPVPVAAQPASSPQASASAGGLIDIADKFVVARTNLRACLAEPW
jgi:hypothetical protein